MLTYAKLILLQAKTPHPYVSLCYTRVAKRNTSYQSSESLRSCRRAGGSPPVCTRPPTIGNTMVAG